MPTSGAIPSNTRSRTTPSSLLSRSDNPIFAPEKEWEKVGQVPNVVLVEGTLPASHAIGVRAREFLFYYGAADKYVAVARATLPSFLRP